MRRAIIVAVILVINPSALAEISDSSVGGFTAVNEVVVGASRAEAWVAAVNDIGNWWSPDHTISGDAARMSIQSELQGCFCETLGEKAGVVHLVVTMVNPTHLLRMTGALGPLGLMGVDGNMIWEFEDAEDGAKVRFTYAVGGYSKDGLDKIAPAVDFVLGEALNRLKTYVETGSPEIMPVD